MTNAKEVVAIVQGLRRILEPRLTEKLNASALYTDLADIYEICKWYTERVDKVHK